MKKRTAALFLALIMSVQGTGSVSAQPMDSNLSFRPKASYLIMGQDLDKTEQAMGYAMEENVSFPAGNKEIAAVKLTEDEAEILKNMGVLVEEDVIFDASSNAVESETKQKKEEGIATEEWNLEAIHGEAYIKDAVAGEPIKIAVLDSGVNYRENLPVQEHVTVLEGMESNPFFEDTSGHGTAVASLIASSKDEESIQGINEDAAIYSVQVLDENNTGTLEGIVKGIYWAIDNDMDIINMSFGTQYPSEILEKAVEDAWDAGILLVAAAGNDPEGNVQYPAAYEEVCAVGASSLKGEIASESVRGKDVDIYAPVAGILVNAPLFGTQVEGGSSLSCAMVSGAASLLWEKDTSRDASYIRALLEETANSGIDPEYGKGLLDVEQAMEEYDSFVLSERDETENETVEKPLLQYDEAEVRALWLHSDHQSMIPNDIGGYRLMYRACKFPDEKKFNDETNKLYENRRFHGSKNYIATLQFLVNLAHEYYLKDAGNPDKVYATAKTNPQLQCSDGWHMDDDIKWYLNQTIFPELGIDETTRHNKAYKIMGAAVHVAGDVYAHRTRVTTAMLSNAQNTGSSSNGYFVKSDFTNWSKFVTDVTNKENAGQGIEFREIGNYLKDVGNNRLYEDNVNVESWRYSEAKKVVQDLIKNGSAYDFRTHGFNQSVLRSLDRLCGVKHP